MNEVQLEELLVSKTLRKPVGKYRNVFPRVAAVIQLVSRWKSVKEGKKIRFLFSDADRHNFYSKV